MSLIYIIQISSFLGKSLVKIDNSVYFVCFLNIIHIHYVLAILFIVFETATKKYID